MTWIVLRIYSYNIYVLLPLVFMYNSLQNLFYFFLSLSLYTLNEALMVDIPHTTTRAFFIPKDNPTTMNDLRKMK